MNRGVAWKHLAGWLAVMIACAALGISGCEPVGGRAVGRDGSQSGSRIANGSRSVPSPRAAVPEPEPTPPPRAKVWPPKAIWVARSAYRSPDEIIKIMDRVCNAGFNTVLFQVRGEGTVYYASKIEPWAVEYGGKAPSFDPLTVACREAHRRGMALHAWVNVMPAWRGGEPSQRSETTLQRASRLVLVRPEGASPTFGTILSRP